MSRKRTIYMRRRHNGIGISQAADSTLGSMVTAAYTVVVHLELDEKLTPLAPAALKDRPYTLSLWPAEAEQIAQQLLHFAGQARAHQEKGGAS